MWVIYHPDSSPSLPGTAPDSRSCAYASDDNGHLLWQSPNTATTSAAGFPPDRIRLEFSQDVVFFPSDAGASARLIVTYDRDCLDDGYSGSSDCAGGDDRQPVRSIQHWNVPMQTFILTPPTTSAGRLAADGATTDRFWAGTFAATGNGVDATLYSVNGLSHTSDGVRIPGTTATITDGTFRSVRDGLPPAPSAAITGSGTGADPYVQQFSEAPAGTAASVFDDVRILRTDTAGERTEVTDAVVISVSGRSVSFVSSATLASTDHMEYVGIRDSVGNVAVQPTIASATRVSDTLTRVTLSAPVTGITEARQWLVGPSAGAEVAITGVAVRTATPTADAAGSLDTDVGVTYEDTFTLLHAPITGTERSVAHVVPAHTSFTDRLSSHVAASGIRIDTPERQDLAAPTFTAALTGTTEVTITFSEPVIGRTAASEWTVAAANPSSITDGTTTASASQTLTIASSGTRTITLTVAEQAPSATPTVTYTQPTGATSNRITDEASNELATTEAPHVTATDRIPPTLEAEFATAATILVTSMEALAAGTVTDTAFMVADSDGNAVALVTRDDAADPPVAPVTYTAGSTTVTLRLAADADEGTYTITPSAMITDANSVPYAAGPISATLLMPFTAATQSATTTLVTFAGDDLRGTLDVGDWKVIDDDRTTERSIVSITLGTTSDGATVSTPHMISTSSTETTLLITHAALSSTAAAPRIEYERPAPPAPTGGFLSEGTVAVLTGFVAATDAAPPTFEAAFTAANEIELTASEALDRDTVIANSAFTVTTPDDNADGNDEPVDLDSTTPVTYTAGSRTVTLMLASDATANIVHTIEPATAIMDTNGVRYAAGSVDAAYNALPTFEAAFTATNVIELTASEALDTDTATAANISITAVDSAGATLTLTPTITTPSSTTIRIALGITAPEGSVFTITPSRMVTDAAGGRYSGDAITLVRDTIAPTFPGAEFTGARIIELTASEALDIDTVVAANLPVTADTNNDGTATPVALHATTPVSYTAGSTTVTITLLNNAAQRVAYIISPTSSLADANGVPYATTATRPMATYDSEAPSATAAFTGRNTIVITFDEHLMDGSYPTAGSAYTVTVPDNTIGSDADADPERITPTAAEYAEQTTESTITLTLPANEMTIGAVHTVTLPNGISDEDGNRIADDTQVPAGSFDAPEPRATAISLTVHDGPVGTNTAKSGTLSSFAGIGDTIRVSLTLDEAVTVPPTIEIPGTGRTPTAANMAPGTDNNAATWHHDMGVTASTVGTIQEASPVAFAFTITATDSGGNSEPITLRTGHALELAAPMIDTTRPELAAGNSLYTTTEYHVPGQTGRGQFSSTAGITDHLWVTIIATETLATPGLEPIGDSLHGLSPARSDATFFPGTTSSVTASTTGDRSPPQYNYSRIIEAGDPEGPVTFSIMIRDRAGNAAVAPITNADLSTIAARNAGYGYHAAIDSSVPTLASATTASRTTTQVTLSESLPSSATTAADEWTVVGGDTTVTVTRAEVSGDTITLTYAEQSVSFEPTVTYAGEGLVDEGRHAVVSGSMLTATDGVAPTFTAAFTSVRTIDLTASEALDIDTVTVANFAVTIPDGSGGTAPVRIAEVDYAAGETTVTLTLAANAAPGTTHTVTPSRDVRDAGGARYAAGGVAVTEDVTAPTFTAEFAGTQAIVLEASEALDSNTITVANFVVTVPDNSIFPDDLGGDRDVVTLASQNPIAYSAGTPPTVTLRLDPAVIARIQQTIDQHGRPAPTYTVSPSNSVADLNGVRYTAGGVNAAADTKPPTFTIAFPNASMIVLTFSEPLLESTVTLANFEITTPDSNGDGNAEPVTLVTEDTTVDPPILPIAYSAGPPTTVTFRLATPAEPNVVYTINPTTTLADMAGINYVRTVPPPSATASDTTAPTATDIEFTVHDGPVGANTAKSGTYQAYAGIGDTIRIAVTLSEDAAGTPTITLAGRGVTNVGMEPGTDNDATTWHYDLGVTSSTAETPATAFAFTMATRDEAGNAGSITLTEGHSLSLTAPIIDTTLPTRTALTTSVRIADASSDAPANTVAGIGDDVRVTLTASEPLVTAAGDIAITGVTTPATVSAAAGNTYTWAHTVTDDDANGQIVFALTITDRAGNEASAALTQADAAARVTVDADTPTIESARTTSTTTLTVTLSEALPSSASTAAGEWAVTDGTTVAAVSGASVSRDTVTVTYAEIADTSYEPTATYTQPTGVGANRLADAGRNAVASGTVTAQDRLPPAASNARFDAAGDILLDLSEPIATPPPTGYSATSTGSDLGTLTPDYTAGTTSLKIVAQNDPTELAVYTIGLPALTDVATPPNSQAAGQTGLTATPPDMTGPMATSLTVTVADSVNSAFTDRTGANAHYANAGDRVTIAVTFNEDVGTPTIRVPGDDRIDTAVAMGNAGDSNVRTWESSFTVAAADDEAALEFTISATDTSSGMNMDDVTQAAITAGLNAIIDVTDPALAATGDALHMRTRHAGTSADVTEPAGIGAQVRIYVTASEALATAAGDATFGAPSRPATDVEPASGTNAYAYYRTVLEADPSGDAVFALTIADRAGNTADLDPTDLTTGRGTGFGHRVSVDTVRPTASAEFSANMITVTFSEAVYGVPETLTVTQPDGTSSAMAAPHNDGETSATITISGTPAIGIWTVAIPDAVRDVARNARDASSATIDAERTAAPTATLISYTVLDSGTARAAPFANYARAGDTIRLAVTLSESVTTAPTVLFVGKTAASDAVTMTRQGTTDEWRAEYTVESTTDAAGIDGAFTFVMTVTADTGATGEIAASSYAQASPPTIDRVVPTIVSAAFPDARTILVSLSEPMARTAATIEGYTYGLTAPDGTNTPDDADSNPDAIALAASNAIGYSAGPPPTLEVSLAADAADGVTYTLELPSALTDIAGNAFADATEDVEYDPPLASALTFAVMVDGAAKGGPRPSLAGIGDTVRIDLTLDADAAAAPLITLDGRDTDAVAMVSVGGSVTAWRHDHTVLASHADATSTAPLALSIMLTGTSGTGATITPTTGLADGTTVTLPSIDATRPTFQATGNAFFTLVQYSVTQSGPETAGVDDLTAIAIRSTEPLVHPNLNDIGAAVTSGSFLNDARFYTDTPSERSAQIVQLRNGLYLYTMTVREGEPEGSIAFSLTIRDRAGNETVLTHENLATVAARDTSDEAFGYRFAVDSSTPTIASARTTSTSTLTATLSESLPSSARTTAGDWALVDGSTTATVSAAEVSGSTVMITYAEIEDTAFTPRVTYSGSGIADAGRNRLSSAPATASDGVAPNVASVAFVDSTHIDVTFSEPVELSDQIRLASAWAIAPPLAITNVAEGASGSIISLTVSQATSGTEYEITVPAIDDMATPPNTSASSVERTTYYDAAAYTATTFRDLGLSEHIRIAFVSEVQGTTVPGEWFVGVNADGTGGTAAVSIARICHAGNTPLPSSSINVAAVCSPPLAGEERTFYLGYAITSSADTPRVAYRAPTGDGATPIVLAADADVAAFDGAVTAADGLPPLFEAATATGRTLTVTFDEDVTGTPDASRWYHYDSTTVPPLQAELDAAVTAGTNFETATLAGRTLTLELPGDYTPTSGWGSGDTAAVPDTIGYRIPAGQTADITDVAPSPNGLVANTADDTVVDGAPPEVTTMTLAVLAGGTSGAAKTDNALFAKDGDAIQVTLVTSEPAATSPAPDLRAFGSSAAMTLDSSGQTATGAIAIPAGTPEGAVSFMVRLADRAAQPNQVDYTEADLTGGNAVIDNTAPTLDSLVRTTDSMSLVFSEPVHGTAGTSNNEATITITPSGGTATTGTLTIGADSPRSSAIPHVTGDASMNMPPVSGELSVAFTGLVDRAGNAIGAATSPAIVESGGEVTAPEIVLPPTGSLTIVAPGDGRGPGGETTLLLESLASDAFGGETVVRIDGATVTFAAATTITDYGTDDSDTSLLFRVVGPAVGEDAYSGAVSADDDVTDANNAAAVALNSADPLVLVELGKAGEADSVTFGAPVSVRLLGAGAAVHVFWLSDAAATQVNSIRSCSEEGHAGADAETAPGLGTSGNEECFVRDGPDTVVWTNHFTQFGASAQSVSRGGGDCDDCTPPTLGVDSTGQRRVAGGFSYNGDVTDAEYYYTPLPLITVVTGEENVATLKIFEDSGPRNVRHAGLGFGLSRGQHFAESEAEIRVSLPYMGEPTVSVDDPANAIDPDSLRAESVMGECMPGSAAECRIVTIYHTFREPLDFNVVSTIVWDDRRNAWQNFFNHGVHVTGDSLNPRHGIPVNGGELVLYPLIAGQADEDGDGIYDFDVRHVTYMLDAEYRVYRLTPAGTYEPVRNLSSLHHEVDDSMYNEERLTWHGALRGTDRFEDLLERERAIAAKYLERMGVAAPDEDDGEPAFVASPEPADRAAYIAELQAKIAAEINSAELAMLELYPEMSDYSE